jgi:hypothetical protein
VSSSVVRRTRWQVLLCREGGECVA